MDNYSDIYGIIAGLCILLFFTVYPMIQTKTYDSSVEATIVGFEEVELKDPDYNRTSLHAVCEYRFNNKTFRALLKGKNFHGHEDTLGGSLIVRVNSKNPEMIYLKTKGIQVLEIVMALIGGIILLVSAISFIRSKVN